MRCDTKLYIYIYQHLRSKSEPFFLIILQISLDMAANYAHFADMGMCVCCYRFELHWPRTDAVFTYLSYRLEHDHPPYSTSSTLAQTLALTLALTVEQFITPLRSPGLCCCICIPAQRPLHPRVLFLSCRGPQVLLLPISEPSAAPLLSSPTSSFQTLPLSWPF